MRLLSVFSLIVFSSVSYANYFPLPVGHYEAFMGNTGGSLEASPGNPLYNPAGLGFRASNKLSLSVSGTALTKHEMKNDENSLSPSDYSIRPLMAAGIYPIEWGTAAVFVASPQMFTLDGSLDYQVGPYDLFNRIKIDTKILKMGAAFGSAVSENFSWGVAAGLQLGSMRTDNYSKLYSGGNLFSTMFNETKRTEKSLFVLPGILFKPFQSWTIGLSAQFSPANLESKTVEYTSTHSSATPNVVVEDSKSYDPHAESQYSVRFSNGLNLLAGNNLFVDLIYVSEGSVQDSQGVVDKIPSLLEYSAGWRNTNFEKLQPMAGFSYTETDDRIDHLGSAGVAFVRGRSELILGGYYVLSEPKGTNKSDMAFSSYGFMFSSNVAY